MPVQQRTNVSWTRKHDKPNAPLFPSVSKILYPQNLEELIEICQTRSNTEFYKAAGSHWALSDAAISDTTFIETHDPNNAFPAMGRTLYDVVPGCLRDEFIKFMKYNQVAPGGTKGNSQAEYLYHFEAGKRIYQLYSEMDMGDLINDRSLANRLRTEGSENFSGPWGLATMGGAGGQTVFGALTTGTHGGDFMFPPIADVVKAVHLVADGGKQYWIERSNDPEFNGIQMTDDENLRSRYGGLGDFEIIRDDNTLNAVLIAAGRFGTVYSVIIGVVRQYSLHTERRLDTWQRVKNFINDPSGAFYKLATDDPKIDNKFLQVAVCPIPYPKKGLDGLPVLDSNRKPVLENLCSVTKHWNVELEAMPNGREERRGGIVAVFDPMINAPRFKNAGTTHPYNPSRSGPGSNPAASASFLEKACEHSNFIAGVLDSAIDEIEGFIHNNEVAIGGGIAGVALAGGVGLLPLIPFLALLLVLLKAFSDWLDQNGDTRQGEVLNTLRKICLDHSDPEMRKAGMLVWQMIAYELFRGQQSNLDYEAISYATMDAHDYLDKSCGVNADSIEVFFNARSPELIAFVDALIAYETGQEWVKSKSFAGYISLRFTSNTKTLIGMQQWPTTCSVEVAGLRDVEGTKELIDFALFLAKNRNINGVLHWGQRHTQSMADIQHRFGDKLTTFLPTDRLFLWRNELSRITENGRLNGFSSKFTRFTGLEIVKPIIYALAANPSATVGTKVRVTWDCFKNPPYTNLVLDISAPTSSLTSLHLTTLRGAKNIPVSQRGVYKFRLTAICTLNGESRRVSRSIKVIVS